MKGRACTGVLFSFVMTQGIDGLIRKLKADIVDKTVETLQLLLPSVLYMAENNLLFTAVSNLDPGTYQVLSKLKTLVTRFLARPGGTLNALRLRAGTRSATTEHITLLP
jgi:hypothetical protein